MRYRVESGVLRLGPGFVLGLTPEQAMPRRHNLRIEGEHAVVVVPVEFKAGETIDIVAGDLGAAALDRLVALDEQDQPRLALTRGSRRRSRDG